MLLVTENEVSIVRKEGGISALDFPLYLKMIILEDPFAYAPFLLSSREFSLGSWLCPASRNYTLL